MKIPLDAVAARNGGTAVVTRTLALVAILAARGWAAVAASGAGADDDWFRPIFDGRTFDGWKAADMSFWSIEDGALTARITPGHPLPANLYLIWQGEIGRAHV